MKSQTTSMLEVKGFTLFEIIIVIALITGLFAIGSLVDFSMYSRKLLSAEQETLVSILHKAQNQAMNNINAKTHGIHIETDTYTIFEGSNYISSSSTNEVMPKNSSIIITGLNDIVFEQLSGNRIPNQTGNITLSDGVKNKQITITEGGLIDW